MVRDRSCGAGFLPSSSSDGLDVADLPAPTARACLRPESKNKHAARSLFRVPSRRLPRRVLDPQYASRSNSGQRRLAPPPDLQRAGRGAAWQDRSPHTRDETRSVKEMARNRSSLGRATYTTHVQDDTSDSTVNVGLVPRSRLVFLGALGTTGPGHHLCICCLTSAGILQIGDSLSPPFRRPGGLELAWGDPSRQQAHRAEPPMTIGGQDRAGKKVTPVRSGADAAAELAELTPFRVSPWPHDGLDRSCL